MPLNFRKLGKQLLKKFSAGKIMIFNWELVLLPKGARLVNLKATKEAKILPIRYSYRSSPDGWVEYKLLLSGSDFYYHIYEVDSNIVENNPTNAVFSFSLDTVTSGDRIKVNINTAEVIHNDARAVSKRYRASSSRKYVAKLILTDSSGNFSRIVPHYLPYDNKQIGRDYYFGDDYRNYYLQVDTPNAVGLVKKYCSGGRLLDVGCALGMYTKAFLESGFDSYGIDISAFAISEAGKLLGSERVHQCNLDNTDIPIQSSFDVFWMWDVLEHSSVPYKMLKRISNKASPGAFLFLHTSNADSLTHKILEKDWEGYTDYSHYGVDSVTASNINKWLKELKWEIVEWKCNQIWINETDPLLSNLRDVFHQLPELSDFLNEYELGDMILLVAKKQN